MDRIGERLIWHYIPFTDIALPMGGLNIMTVFNTLVVMAILLGLCRLAIRRMALVPSRSQYAVEMLVGLFDNLVSSSLELETRRQNRRFLPLILCLFVFLLISNFMSFLPTHYFEEPTADVNCTLSLALLGFVIALYCGIRVKGVGNFFTEFLGPLWHQEGATGGALIAGKLSALFFLPLNIIGEMAKIVSISFRLFGNIIGGGIIIVVVSSLVYFFSPLSVFLDLFFVFFVGTVQAFVFTMLTLTYISVAIK